MTSTASNSASAPLVSIGLPVFNGAMHLAQTIESILTQTFKNFELVICDNASTDATPKIAEFYAHADSRVRYYRNESNLGAGPNYDLCFHRTDGTYFKWSACDDLLAPKFLERSVELMESHPGAAFCAVGIAHIDGTGKIVQVDEAKGDDLGSPRIATRFKAGLLNQHGCTNIFSLFRRSILEQSRLHGNFAGSDHVLMLDILMRGPAVTAPEVLIYDRDHPGRVSRSFADRDYMISWWDTSKTGCREMFNWVTYGHFLQLAWSAPLSPADRLTCLAALMKWWTLGQNARRMAGDLVWRLNPALLRLARRWRLPAQA